MYDNNTISLSSLVDIFFSLQKQQFDKYFQSDNNSRDNGPRDGGEQRRRNNNVNNSLIRQYKARHTDNS